MKRTLAFILTMTALVPARLKGADTTPTNAPAILPGTVVVGRPQSLTSPSADRAAEQKTQIPGGFTIKTAEDMNQGRASNFLDLLQGVPGLFLQSENGTEMSRVSIRGSGIESDDEPLGVEFLLDGMSFNQGDGETIIEDFDVNTLKYAEVYRGADAFKYGALTMGGAINLVPFTGYDADPFQIRLEAGSYNFLRGQVSSGGVDGPLDYYASVSGRYREGYRDHSQENTELLFTDLGYKINSQLENRFYLTADQTDRQLPGGLTQQQMQDNPQQADPDALAQDFSKQWYYLRLADKISYDNAGHELSAGLYWWGRSLEEKGFYATNDFEQGIQTYVANNAGINLNAVIPGQLFGQRNRLTAGASPAFETEQDHFYANNAGQKGDTIARDLELSVNVPLYLENQLYLAEPLSVVAGFQAIYALRHFYDQFNDTSVGNQSAQQHFYGFNPKIGVLYEFNDDSQAFLNFSRSWQPPSFDNMVTFGDGTNTSLTYTPLDPQHAWTVEAGTRGGYGRFNWDLALYHSWVWNELLDLYDANGVDRGDVNVDHTSHQGIEAGLDVELWNSQKEKDRTGRRLTLSQTYTLNDFHFANDPVYGNNRLGAIPIHVYGAELMYETPGGFYAGPNVQCNLSRYPVDQQNTLYAGAYALLGFKTGLTIGRGKSRLSIFFEAKNLTDERYAASVDPIPNGQNPVDPQVFHPGDGRSFYGGVTYSW